ncbi:hypothetical protein B0I35DRAFT_189204 [Stachybotrys elegans]|uniref:Uncharacterized protein n=1 Tax=Stachybotrys elegans TaxID=80388 RepID=A0A8K0T046_9HYPO|nr:hypothetical protein B0I35DRAFT_189204 [Stachybotrys elegans]
MSIMCILCNARNPNQSLAMLQCCVSKRCPTATSPPPSRRIVLNVSSSHNSESNAVRVPSTSRLVSLPSPAERILQQPAGRLVREEPRRTHGTNWLCAKQSKAKQQTGKRGASVGEPSVGRLMGTNHVVPLASCPVLLCGRNRFLSHGGNAMFQVPLHGSITPKSYAARVLAYQTSSWLFLGHGLLHCPPSHHFIRHSVRTIVALPLERTIPHAYSHHDIAKADSLFAAVEHCIIDSSDPAGSSCQWATVDHRTLCGRE